MKPQILSDTFVSSAYLRRRARRAALLQPGVPYPGPQPSGIGIQALPAPEVQNTYNNGLGRDKLLGDFAMIDILIPAWDFQQADDKIVLHWGTFFSQTFNYSGTPGAQLIRVAGSDLAGDPVPGSDRFTGDGTHQVWYELITAGATPYSDAVDITVKCARPGGIDPRPDTPHLNENLRPATCAPNPIDESAILATFTILPWDNMEREDTLSLYIAGRSFPGKPVVVGRPQEIELSTADLRNWITPGPAVPVTYEIIDRVGNRSRFAPYLDLDMWLPKEPQLEAPAFFDANGHELPGPLDPGMGTLLVRVPRYLGWVTGEHVTVNLISYDADHKRDARDLPPMTWKATDYYLDARVPDDVLPPLGGGTLLAGYTTTRDDRPGTSVASYLRQIQVVEGPVAKLPAVSLPAENDGKLVLPGNDGDVVDITVPDSVALVEYARVTLRMSGAASKIQSRDIAQGDGHKPLTFHWTRADLAPAIDASVTFTYTIEVRGRTEVYESEPHTVRVLAEDVVDPPDPDLLPAPRITGLVGGVLQPTLPEMEVIVPIGEASVRDALVTVIATGSTTERRTTRLFGREEATVQFDGWPVQNDGMEAIVSYEIQPPTGALRKSEETAFRVGDVTGKYPPPVVEGAVDGTYDPKLAKNGLIVTVPAELTTNDQIVLRFGTYATTPLRWTPNMKLTIPPGEVANVLGTTVEVDYTVLDGGRSTPLKLFVSPIKDEDDKVLPTPSIGEAEGNVVALDRLANSATVIVAPWLLIAEGQHVWITMHGTNQSGGLEIIEVCNNLKITAAMVRDGMQLNVPRAAFEALKDNTPLSVEAFVAFAKQDARDKAIALPIRTYTFTLISRDVTEDFESLQLGDLPADFTTPHVHISGRKLRCYEIARFPYLDGKCIYLIAGGQCRIDLLRDAVYARFGLRTFHTGTVKYVDSSGTVVGETSLPEAERWVEYTSARGQYFRYVDITGPDFSNLAIDNLTFR